MCNIDITNYPFDEQVCVLTFGAWSYHTSKMNLSNMESTVNLDSYNVNGEWLIIATEVRTDGQWFMFTYPILVFVIQLLLLMFLVYMPGGRRSPAVACWASDHWVACSNPLRDKFRH